MDPWFDTREIPDDAPLTLPAWMNEKAREEVLEQLPIDYNKGARWWAGVWQQVSEEQAETPEFLMLATAMAATMGWPAVVENLIDMGAPIAPIDRPLQGWQWIQKKGELDKPVCSVIEACLWGMRGFTTVAPLHPGRAKSLDVLFDHGADPQLISWRAAIELLSHGTMAAKFIDAGLQASKSSTALDRGGEGQVLMDVLFSSRIDLASAARGRVLDAFIRNGMPVRIAPDKPSLIQYIASSVAGLSQMHVALKHPDKEALGKDILENQDLLEKRAQRMNEEKRTLFLSQVMQVAVIDAATPGVAPARSRPRF